MQASDSLKLDHSKNNSHHPENTPKICPNIAGSFRGIQRHGDKLVGISGFVPCKSWGCEVCAPKKARQLRRRIFKGPLVADALVKGQRSNYSVKVLTLTCPGAEWRERYTPAQADEQVKHHFANLEKALRKLYGPHGYFWVEEAQRDGYPHLHVLLVGDAIAPRDVKAYIEGLWRETYGMGFVRLNIVVNSVQHAVRYLTKYLTKGLRSLRLYSRVFSCSRGALLPVQKPNWLKIDFHYKHLPLPDEEVKTSVAEYDLTHGIPEVVWGAITEEVKRKYFWPDRSKWVKDWMVGAVQGV